LSASKATSLTVAGGPRQTAGERRQRLEETKRTTAPSATAKAEPLRLSAVMGASVATCVQIKSSTDFNVRV